MKFFKKKNKINRFQLTVLGLAVIALLAVIFVAYQNNYGNLFSGYFMRVSPKITTYPTTRSLTVTTPAPTIQFASVNKEVFNPDKEGVNITWNMEGTSSATAIYIYISDSEGNNIFRKQFTSTEDPSYLKPGGHSWYWNGKGYTNQPVPYNGYKIKVYGSRNSDSIAPKYAYTTGVPNVLTRQGDADTLAWPYGQPTLDGLKLVNNNYDYSKDQFNIVCAFELQETSGDNTVYVDFRTTGGMTLQSFQVKDLPAGTYYYKWDGTKWNGEMVVPASMSGKSFRFAVSGNENGTKMNESGPEAVIAPFYGS